MSRDIYASDRGAAPEADFVDGELRHLVLGNCGNVATADAITEFERAAARFDRDLVIEPDLHVRTQTLRRIATVREAIRKQLPERDSVQVDLAHHISQREGNAQLYTPLDEVVGAADLEHLDHLVSARFVSNPRSGEFVKGHAIVLAELGLCPYHGKIVRDPELFDGAWSKPRRAEHLVARLAFTQELWSSWVWTR